ncbi:MAG: ATPase, T2SS/T4P/T4SS family [Planctomycetota bacterium]
MAYLEIVGPGVRKNLTLDSRPVSIGRHSRNDIRLDDDQASRQHAVVHVTSKGVVVRDLQSRNGTTLNGERITKAALQHGSVFVIGRTKFRLRLDDAATSPAPAPAAAPPAAAPSSDDDAVPIEIVDIEPADIDGDPDDSGPLNLTFDQDDDGLLDLPDEPRRRASTIEKATAGLVHLSESDKPKEADINDPLAELDAVIQIELEGDDPVDDDDDGAAPRVRSSMADGLDSIESLLTAGFDLKFSPNHLALVNARGATVHKAQRQGDATAEVLETLRKILYGCMRTNASDIHLEPVRGGYRLRIRVDGAMVQVGEMNEQDGKRFASLIKVLTDIDLAGRDAIQEGHFSCHAPNRAADYRVSFTPSMFGQKLVVRVLDPYSAPQTLSDLELPPYALKKIRGVLRQDTGMIVVCGPTGSGKTTTLYAGIREIDIESRNVLTIEDPVEYELAGLTQIPVDQEAGRDFATLLRSCLRQDPDVIVLGEIRDKDTAVTAMQAANSGHNVLTTVHAKDTITTVFRLLDLGVEPYLIGSTLNLVLAQRLIRTLCPQCKVARNAKPTEIIKLGKSVEGAPKLYEPAGCKHCFGSGYIGRRAIFELLEVTDDIRDVVIREPNIASIKKAVEMTVFTPLKSAAFDLVMAGETSMGEVQRVVGLD